MCLSEIYTDADMNRIVEELPEVALGVVEVWKVAEAIGGVYSNWFFPPVQPINYQPFSKADVSLKIKNAKGTTYWAGFHFYPNPFGAQEFRQTLGGGSTTCQPTLIKCLIKKDWITAAGKDIGLALVTSQAFFPTYPETEARLEDFLAWLKENDTEYAESQEAVKVKV